MSDIAIYVFSMHYYISMYQLQSVFFFKVYDNRLHALSHLQVMPMERSQSSISANLMETGFQINETSSGTFDPFTMRHFSCQCLWRFYVSLLILLPKNKSFVTLGIAVQWPQAVCKIIVYSMKKETDAFCGCPLGITPVCLVIWWCHRCTDAD